MNTDILQWTYTCLARQKADITCMVSPQLLPPIEASNLNVDFLMALRTSSDILAYARLPAIFHPTGKSRAYTVDSKPNFGPMTIPLWSYSLQERHQSTSHSVVLDTLVSYAYKRILEFVPVFLNQPGFRLNRLIYNTPIYGRAASHLHNQRGRGGTSRGERQADSNEQPVNGGDTSYGEIRARRSQTGAQQAQGKDWYIMRAVSMTLRSLKIGRRKN
ncbi:unnamed protein product [Schistocephalus solidus]|uniref:Glycosyltransferase family 92 protein n=1 Tax=Schistocephalus solidus TaxID=70667 RepID=A0A183SX29_SCHSO|nr:unnamed protein product [Schistocephalus solidus]